MPTEIGDFMLPTYMNWMIYRDIDDNGESFTIYDNLGNCIGSYLSDDPFLAEVRKDAPVVPGIDNREFADCNGDETGTCDACPDSNRCPKTTERDCTNCNKLDGLGVCPIGGC
jgi:hypothetical protein